MFHVKPSNPIDSQYSDLLREQADSLGVEVDASSCSLLLAHLKLVLRANSSFNLTSITDSDSAIRLHIVDSLVGGSDEYTGIRWIHQNLDDEPSAQAR